MKQSCNMECQFCMPTNFIKIVISAIVACSSVCTESALVTDTAKDPDYVQDSYTESHSSVSYKFPHPSQFTLIYFFIAEFLLCLDLFCKTILIK